MQKAISFNDVAIVSVKGKDYKIDCLYMRKDENKIYLRNTNLTGKNLSIIKLKWINKLL